MARTKVSSKYQIVIPKEVRENAGVEIGQEFEVIAKGSSITLVPKRPLSSLRGFLKGMPTANVREKKDRF